MAMRKVDSREPWDTIIAPLIETGWERDTLFSGDFAFLAYDMSKIGITRKTTADLLGSINTEDFSRQLEEMLTQFDICIFVHEVSKDIEYWPQTDELVIYLHDKTIRRSRLSVHNNLHTWQVKGFSLERTISPANTVKRLNELYTLYQKPYSKSAYSRKYRDDRILALPSGMRGKKGEELLKDKSLFELAQMSIPDLESFNGIGSKLSLIHI